ncbi:class I SAM-dependent DNA methyltransferase [Ignatzschineria sp. LJL83]
MSLGSFVKSIQNIMRGDSGINGDAQRIEQMTWMIFLKIYGSKEENWAFTDPTYQSIIPDELKWQNWAKDRKDGKALTGEALLDFVNQTLFPTLKNLPVDINTPMKQLIVKNIFEDANQYMKDGILLRQVINLIDDIDFDEYDDKHAFGEIYETILKSLQSAGNAGEFYTPRAVTDFMVEILQPKLGERVADFACGTGGFLTSTLKVLDRQVETVEDRELFQKSLFGIEKKPLPHMLGVTNLLLHDLDNPMLVHGNGLEGNVREYKPEDRFDIVIMNPPYGGKESDFVKNNFPKELQSGETADLFMSVAMYRLKHLSEGGGRCAIIIPDGFLFGADSAKTAIKKKLITDFNLHTIVRLPNSVFAPYTSITTNILFFDNSKKTEDVWFYRFDMPEGYKNFSKTRPMKFEHFEKCIAWWNQREVIADVETETFKAQKFSKESIVANGFNLDLCGYPSLEEEVLSPEETIRDYHQKRTTLNARIDKAVTDIAHFIGIDLDEEVQE